MISHRCRFKGRGSVILRFFTSSLGRCAAARVILAMSSLSLLASLPPLFYHRTRFSITSPLGTVHSYNGTYYVSEKRSPNTHQRSKTLTIDAQWVEDEFRRRLLGRIDSTNYEQMLYDALRNVKANNVRAVVSVDQQSAGYQAEIRNIEAFILANGAKTDQKTLQEFNQTLATDRTNLANLETKKNEANAEEQDLRDLCTTLWDFRNHVKKGNERLRRFIKLATDVVSIDEYSSHFIRLTVGWCTPFAQVDGCYFYRENRGKMDWSDKDERHLQLHSPQHILSEHL